MKINNAIFPGAEGPGRSVPRLWDIDLVDGIITSVKPAENNGNSTSSTSSTSIDAIASQLMLPALCHPHLHLDKAYLLTGCCGGSDSSDNGSDDYPSYADLLPQTGSFAEALHTTAEAKARFTAADLRRRGMQLLAASHAQGVASARVFVEVDADAAGRGTTAVAVAGELQAQWRGTLDVQVCAFAQEVLFTGAAGVANRGAVEDVLQAQAQANTKNSTVAALGVTPYVEATRAQALQNLDWAVATALAHGLHLDVHLDYNLLRPCSASEPLVFALVDALVRQKWTEKTAGTKKTIVVGHATQLTRLPPSELRRLAAAIQQHGLPIYFVGLPTSDQYMMGRQTEAEAEAETEAETDTENSPPRATLNVVSLARDYGLQTCLGVNNVGNAFTPHGTGDPLQLACWGVGLYHAGRAGDATALYAKVSWDARKAIGLADGDDDTHIFSEEQAPTVGTKVGRTLVVTNPRWMSLPPALVDKVPPVPARPRLGFRDVVWDPPDVRQRRLV